MYEKWAAKRLAYTGHHCRKEDRISHLIDTNGEDTPDTVTPIGIPMKDLLDGGDAERVHARCGA
jgi:hypothetical protein